MARAILGILSTLLFVGILLAIGGGIYQAGVAQGIVDAGRVPAGAAVGMAHLGWGWGFHPFGFLGLLFPLLFLFLLIGLVRAAFGRGRGWGHRHDGYGYGGWGRGGPMGGPGDGPEGWRAERERRMAELHQRLHDEEARKGGSSAAAGSTGSAADTAAS